MKTKLLALAVACATASFAANAAVSDTWSAGAAAGYVHGFDHHFHGVPFDEEGYGLKLNGEYNFTDWFGLGAGYDYTANQHIGHSFARSSLHSNIGEVYGRFAYPLDNNGSDIFFKVGPTANWASAYGETHYKLGAVAGIGAQYAFNDNFAVRAGYDYFYKNMKREYSRVDNGMLYLGVQYTFGAKKAAAPAPVAPAQKTVRVTENHTLDAGILFPFDGSNLSAEGKQAVAQVVTSSNNLQNTEFEVYGYTDRIGSDAYNNKLSQKRADAVAAELQNNGVTTLKASEGRGKSNPVTGDKCNSVQGRKALIDCLAADRRVEVVVTGDTTKVEKQ